MAKARSRAIARKVKDKWKAKKWYQIQAPPLFDNVPVAETLAEKPELLIGRVTEVSLQHLTNDFRKSHIKLFFKVHEIDGSSAQTQMVGHTLTSDYIRRMIRRRRSRIDGVYDIETRDGARMRVKPFATTERRIQSSQKKLIREKMKQTIAEAGKTRTLNEFIRDALDGKIGSDIYKTCKSLYPVKRVEIYKTEIFQQPTVHIEEKRPEPKEKPEETKELESEQKEDKPKTKKKTESSKKKESEEKQPTEENESDEIQEKEEEPAEKKEKEKPSESKDKTEKPVKEEKTKDEKKE